MLAEENLMADDFELRLAAVAQPGDTLILEVVSPATLTEEKAAEIKAAIAERLPEIKTVLIGNGLRVGAVVRGSDL